jgi:hypothetical protein
MLRFFFSQGNSPPIIFRHTAEVLELAFRFCLLYQIADAMAIGQRLIPKK